MREGKTLPATERKHHQQLPTFSTNENGHVQIELSDANTLPNLFNVQTHEAASGLMTSAINALGRNGENYRDMMAAMQVELDPRDAIEAMLIAQMTATHVAMTSLSQKMMDTSSGFQVREALERSMTRLSRTFLAQMESLKKYRANAQQVVRVERVTVNEGGQAIVGDVSHGGGG